MCFGCSKELSHSDGSSEYPQRMFWLRNKEINFLLGTLNHIQYELLISSMSSVVISILTHSLLVAIFVNIFLQISHNICVLGAQKNSLIEMVLLSTHNICFG